MLAAVIQRPHELIVTERPVPSPGPGEVLVRVAACGVCGTDLHILQGEYWGDYPRVPGHELSGTVAALGAGVAGLSVGERVVVNPNLPCGLCAHCRRGQINLCVSNTAVGVTRDGGFAEYCVAPAPLVLPLPAEVSLPAGALAEPLSCCLHGIDRTGLRAGDSVILLGAGTIGLLLLQLACHAGASRIISVDPVAEKRELALQLGATAALSPEAVAEERADLVIEAAGRPATAQQALELVAPGGTVLFFGVCPPEATISVKPHELFFRELTLLGSYVNPFTTTRALELLASGVVRAEPLLSHRYALPDTPEAFATVARGEAVKAIVEP